MKTNRIVFLVSIAASVLVAAVTSVKSQSPQPVVVQAAGNPAPASATHTSQPAAALATQNSAALQVAIQTLEKIKTGNAEILKRQEATLQQLEEMQQAAEELKIFSKRG